MSASSLEACPEVSVRLAAAWTLTSALLCVAPALTPSFMAAKNGLSRPLIMTPTFTGPDDFSPPALPPPPSSPPHAARIADMPTAVAIAATRLRELLMGILPPCGAPGLHHGAENFPPL